MKKILTTLMLFLSVTVFAQNKTNNSNIIYKIKLAEVASPGEAKIARKDLYDLFDSSLQTYSVTDSVITIKSSFDESDVKFKNKLTSYGYTVQFFSKKYNINTSPK